MEKYGQVNTILGSALLFTVIISIFSLPNRFFVYIITSGDLKSGLNLFIRHNALWIIATVGIILILIRYINKSDQVSCTKLLKDESIRLITGIFVIIEGLINLSQALPTYIMSIQMVLKSANLMGNDMNSMVTKVIALNVISIVIVLCQILLGVYLVGFLKKRGVLHV